MGGCETGLRARSRKEIVERANALQVDTCASQRALLAEIAAMDRTQIWADDGCYDMAHWLRANYHLSATNSSLWVKAAHALEVLPHLGRALETGHLGLDKVLQLARFLSEENELRLIEWARRVTVQAIRDEANLHKRIDDVKETIERRFFDMWWSEDGSYLKLYGELEPADGAIVLKAISRLADKLPDLPEDEDDPNPLFRPTYEDLAQRRRADALVALAMAKLAEDSDADRSTVVMHTTLSSATKNSKIENGPVIHPDVAQRLRCDGRLKFVLTEEDGNATGIGHTSRNIPAWIMRELRHRDHGCTFPGCGRRFFLQGHHIIHWPKGPTDLEKPRSRLLLSPQAGSRALLERAAGWIEGDLVPALGRAVRARARSPEAVAARSPSLWCCSRTSTYARFGGIKSRIRSSQTRSSGRL
ncbi:MAG TPA: DUF222 domain-containing protein [Actinomycetota bacterium]|nr:DUF222 domain-containing protein [Actinomycetota bacterium]